MSFFGKFFGYGSSEPPKEEVQQKQTEDLDKEIQEYKGDTSFIWKKSKSIQPPYIETNETALRKQGADIFENGQLSLDKVFDSFLDELSKFKKTEFTDVYRAPEANKNGGIDFHDQEVTSFFRSSGIELVKQVGKKIISGDFNLTTISFPIKVMIPYTMLQSCGRSLFQIPYYMNMTHGEDIVERLKLTITATISSFAYSGYFLKPMNPVIGETYESVFSDGSKYFAEQTSHHPPVTSYELIGPNKSYYYSGYSQYSSTAWLNSFSVTNKGKRYMQFPDGVRFDFAFFLETFSNSFWGTLKHETHGEVVYEDKKNNIICKVQLGMKKGETTDSLNGEIIVGSKVVSVLKGSYLSHIEFDGKRYWDFRENFPIKVIDTDKPLPSSSLLREDRILLEQGRLEEAQIAKEKIENLQRADRKLRQNYKKA